MKSLTIVNIRQLTLIPAFFLSLLLIFLGSLFIVNAAQTIVVGLLVAAAGVVLAVWAMLAWHNSYRIALFGLLLCSVLLVPPLPEFGNLTWRVHQVMLLILVPLIMYWRRHTISRLDLLLGLYGLSIISSMLVGSIMGHPPILRDWFELAKPGFWWLMFSFGLGCGWSWKFKNNVLWLFLVCGTGITALSIAQYTHVADVNAWLTPIFVTNEDFLRTAGYRVVGTFGNPVRLGSTMAGFLGVIGVFIFFGKFSLPLRLLLILYGLAVATAILMTGSRIALAAGGLAIVGVGGFFLWFRVRLTVNSLVVIGLTGLLGLLGIVSLVFWTERIARDYTYSDAILSGNPLIGTLYRVSLAGNEFASGARRLSDWQLAWQLGLESPIFGTGASKSVDAFTYFHSEYLTTFRRYGLLGLFLFIFIYVNIIYFAYKNFRSGIKSSDQEKTIVSLSVLIFVGVFALDGIFSNGAASDFQQSAVLWWLVGVLYGREQRKKTAPHSTS